PADARVVNSACADTFDGRGGGQREEILHGDSDVESALPCGDEDLREFGGTRVDVGREPPTKERKRADATDLQAGVALGIRVAGHAQLLDAYRGGEGLQVQLTVCGHHHQVWLALGRVLFDHERLVDLVRWHASRLRHLGGRADRRIELEQLVRNLALHEHSNGQGLR